MTCEKASYSRIEGTALQDRDAVRYRSWVAILFFNEKGVLNYFNLSPKKNRLVFYVPLLLLMGSQLLPYPPLQRWISIASSSILGRSSSHRAGPNGGSTLATSRCRMVPRPRTLPRLFLDSFQGLLVSLHPFLHPTFPIFCN